MDRSMEIDKSNDNIAFNGINLNESNNDSDDEDGDNNMSIDHNTLRNKMIINEPSNKMIIMIIYTVSILYMTFFIKFLFLYIGHG
jgi:hypothetical protein